MTAGSPSLYTPEQWPADRPERRKVASLIPYARNSRTHSDAQVAQIAASIKEWGFTNPVLIEPDGGIIAGHGRVMAAQRLGLDEVPCVIAEGWTEAQKRAYVIADNKLAMNAGWDNAMLAVEFGELKDFDFDVSLTGFSDDELKLFEMADEELPGEGENAGSTASLADKFGIPPFSVLNAREGWWQNRKRAWLALGIKSELGRGENEGGGGALTFNITASGKQTPRRGEV
jgi:ParB-like chromosome segregation protein Spo0J